MTRACVIGVAQHTWRPEDTQPAGAPEPLAMWDDVARDAAADAGAPGAIERLDRIDVVYCQSWQYDDPPRRLAERLGAHPKDLRHSGAGGTVPQALLADAVAAIERGDLDVALVAGGEALATRRRMRHAGERPAWSHPPAHKRPFPFDAPFHPAEIAHGAYEAWLTFALFDVAHRAASGAAPDAHRRSLGELVAPLSAVAARHPGAWFPVALTVDEIITPRTGNRMVGYPYTKRMTAMMDVDMAAAVLVASDEAADSLGVADDRRVYLRGHGYAEDPRVVAAHPDLASSPAMARAARAALGAAGAAIDDVGYLDLYACFPSSISFALDALRIDPATARSPGLAVAPPRPVTLTGGLAYHGGPGSNTMTHALATLVGALRDDPGSLGLASGVGMHMTKHAFGIWSTDPGTGQAVGSPADAAQRMPAPEVPVAESYDGPATVATYTVVHGRDGDATHAVVVCDIPGGRCYAHLDDAGALDRAEAEELVGAPVAITAGDGAPNSAHLLG